MLHGLIAPRRVLAPVPVSGRAPEGLALLAEIGVASVGQGFGSQARPIFELIEAAQPENAAGPIGLALIDLGEGRDAEAVSRLRRAIAVSGRCVDEARAVLCVILSQLGRRSEATVLRKRVLRGPDGPARRMLSAFFAAGAPQF